MLEELLRRLSRADERVGRSLTLVVPAGSDRFFEEFGEPGTYISSPLGSPDVEKLLEISKRYVRDQTSATSHIPAGLKDL